MIVKIEEIQREGGYHLDTPITEQFVQEALDEIPGQPFKAKGGFQLKAHFQKVGEGVLLKGGFKFDVNAPCKRCIVDVPMTLPQSFTLQLVAANLAADYGVEGEGDDDEKAETGGSFDLGAADEDTFDGKKIDTDPIVREQLLLALPMVALCKEDCQGLCTVCGQNLNEKKCGCDTRVIDPRLAALKDIKLS